MLGLMDRGLAWAACGQGCGGNEAHAFATCRSSCCFCAQPQLPQLHHGANVAAAQKVYIAIRHMQPIQGTQFDQPDNFSTMVAYAAGNPGNADMGVRPETYEKRVNVDNAKRIAANDGTQGDPFDLGDYEAPSDEGAALMFIHKHQCITCSHMSM